MVDSVLGESQVEPPHSEAETNPILALLPTLRKHWAIVVLGVEVGWALALAYWTLAPTVYESSTEVLVISKDLGASGVNTQKGTQITEDTLATQMQVVQSSRIVRDALARSGLNKSESIVAKLDADEDPTKYVQDRLDITRGGTGRASSAHVLRIAFRHTEPRDAQRVVQAVLGRYQEFVGKQFRDVNQEAASLIDQARQELEDDIAQTEHDYIEMRRNAPLLWNGEVSTNIHRDRYEEVQLELSEVRIRASKLRPRVRMVDRALRPGNQELAHISSLERLAVIDEESAVRMESVARVVAGEAGTAFFQALQPNRAANATAEFSTLTELVAEEARLLDEFGSRHPELVATRQKIEVLTDFLAEKKEEFGIEEDTSLEPENILQAYLGVLRNDLAAIEEHQAELEGIAEDERELAKELVAFELEDETMRTRLERKQDLYDAVLGRLRDINLRTEYGGMINEVVSSPRRGEKVWPIGWICVMLGCFLGLVLGSGGAVVWAAQDDSFEDVDDVAETLGTKVLAAVPSLQPSRGEREAIARSGSGAADVLCTLHDPMSPKSEVFRGLRTLLFFASQRRSLRTIAMTSPKQGDGKSTVLANLAVCIGQTGRKVLVVDCDMRRPTQHTLWGVSGENGLRECLDGDTDLTVAILETEAENVSVLTAGERPGNPAELLESAEFSALVSEASARFDFVLFDCPPVLAVSDPCVVAARCDGVLLTIRATQDTRKEAMLVRDRLDEAGGDLLGVAVNIWDAKNAFVEGAYAGRYYAYDEDQPATARRVRRRGRRTPPVPGAESGSDDVWQTDEQ